MSQNRAITGKFQKGISGNPGGRPKMPKEVKRLFEERGVDVVKELFVLATCAYNEKVRLEAIKEILNRWLGKVPENDDICILETDEEAIDTCAILTKDGSE